MQRQSDGSCVVHLRLRPHATLQLFLPPQYPYAQPLFELSEPYATMGDASYIADTIDDVFEPVSLSQTHTDSHCLLANPLVALPFDPIVRECRSSSS